MPRMRDEALVLKGPASWQHRQLCVTAVKDGSSQALAEGLNLDDHAPDPAIAARLRNEQVFVSICIDSGTRAEVYIFILCLKNRDALIAQAESFYQTW